ncbi:MAG TPA: hypothetical protein VF796_04555, partial [Humisphaera sp.]
MQLFSIFLLLIVAAIAYYHFTQGLFSAIISALLAGFASALAIGWHETVVESILGGAMANYAHATVLMAMFGAIYLVLRIIFDRVVPGNVTFPRLADKIGGAAMGAVAGLVAAGTCAFAAQALPFMPDMLGYSRLETTSDRSVTPPSERGQKTPEPKTAFDFLSDENAFNQTDTVAFNKLLFPMDDLVVGTTAQLSGSGALSTGTPLGRVHPDWLMELFGQRLGLETAGRRIAMNTSKQTDVTVEPTDLRPGAGVYLLDLRPPKGNPDDHSTQIRRQNADFDSIHPSKVDWFPTEQQVKPDKQVIVVVRAYFGEKAKDGKTSLIQLSPASSRLVAKRKMPNGKLDWFNYYPVGTLDYIDRTDTAAPIERNAIFYYQRVDDFILIDDSTAGEKEMTGEARKAAIEAAARARKAPDFRLNVADKGIDLVYVVDREGFLNDAPAGKVPTVADGTFLEIKRMARVDLSDKPAKSARESLRAHPAVGPLRKEWAKKNEPRDFWQLLRRMAETRWEGRIVDGDYTVRIALPPSDARGQLVGSGLGRIEFIPQQGATPLPTIDFKPLAGRGRDRVIATSEGKFTRDPKTRNAAPPLGRVTLEWVEGDDSLRISADGMLDP